MCCIFASQHTYIIICLIKIFFAGISQHLLVFVHWKAVVCVISVQNTKAVYPFELKMCLLGCCSFSSTKHCTIQSNSSQVERLKISFTHLNWLISYNMQIISIWMFIMSPCTHLMITYLMTVLIFTDGFSDFSFSLTVGGSDFLWKPVFSSVYCCNLFYQTLTITEDLR